MRTSEIRSKIDETSAIIRRSQEKLNKLLSAKSKVDTIEIALKYIPENAESIKESYNLYGEPYEKMAMDEKQIIVQANKEFKEKQEIVSKELELAIKQVSAIISSNNNLLLTLQNQLSDRIFKE